MATLSADRFHCSDVNLSTEWDELIESFHYSWSSPIQPVSQLTFAHLGTNSPEERDALEAAKSTLLKEAQDAPETMFWIKCVDVKTGKIIGGMNYKYEKAWPKEVDSFTPSWFEEGSEMQKLSQGFYGTLLDMRKQIMKEEHMYGEFAWVDPAYRNSIASQLIVEFALRKSDAMGLPAYSEVNQFSAPLSLRTGFMIAGWTNMTFSWKQAGGKERSVPSREVDRIVRALQAHPIAAVWRPVGGKYIEGETILPWTGKPRPCAKL